MKVHLPLLIWLISISFCVSITLEDLEKTFELEKCIQGSLTSLNEQTGIATMSSKVIQSSYPTGITQEELRLFNISKIQDKSTLSKVHELAQFHDIDYDYKLISEEGPPHNRIFKVQLMLGEEVYEGEAKTKKKAQQYAANIALQNTKYNVKPPTVDEVKISALTPTVKLNNIAAKLGMGVKYALDTVEGTMFTYKDPTMKSGHAYVEILNNSIYHQEHQHQEIESRRKKRGPYNVRVTVDTMEFIGRGSTEQDARHDAAQKAIDHLKRKAIDKKSPCTKEGGEEECKQMKESIKSPISKIHEAGQKHNKDVKFEIINELGPAHKKLFVTRCTLGDFVTDAEGHSKKESKRLAAEKMLENLKFLPDIVDDTNEIVNALKPKKKKNKKKKLQMVSPEETSVLENFVDSTLNIFGDYPATDMKSDSVIDSSSGQTNKDNYPSNQDNLKNKKSKFYSSRDAKNTLLNIGASLEFETHFHDLQGKQNEFYTLVSVGVHPPYLCFGKASSKEDASNRASIETLKLLFRNGIENKLYNKILDKEYVSFVLREFIYPDVTLGSSKDAEK